MVSALNRKLLRDLLKMRGQALAIAMVVAAGVAMYVMYLASFASLARTKDAYYERHRFADVFASLKRAPLGVAGEIAALPGVDVVDARIASIVPLVLDDLAEPASARLVSISASRRPPVNDLYLRRGRWIESGRPDEVLASEGFVSAHRMHPGDRIPAVINGRLRRLTLVGVVLSPEFVYSIRPGDLIPDDRRFGILWMDRQALAAAFDMQGGFNDVALTLDGTAAIEDVLASVDRVLEPYGGLGALPRALQLSNWAVENELKQLQSFGWLLPLIFLLVAAFILNVALTRALALQRPQIASLKALGYSNGALAWHYAKWALIIGAAGGALGLVAGAWLGRMLIELYNKYFRFPELSFIVTADVLAGALGLTLLGAAAGAYAAVSRAVRVPPAEAMRPEAPARFRRTIMDTPAIARRLGTAGRMITRNLWRHPLRAAMSIFGIGCAMAILMIGLVMTEAMDRLLEMQFAVAERQDVTVSFVEPRSSRSVYALARLPGVLAVEPQRQVAARARAGHRERYISITGVPASPRFKRVVNRDGRSLAMPSGGLVLSRALADALHVGAGDTMTLEVLEGRRPIHQTTVTGLVDDVIGLSAFMELDALHRLLREDDLVSGALLLIDPAQDAALSKALQSHPAVAGAGFRRAVLQNFRDTMAANMAVNIGITLLFAGVIAFGVVYNAARVSLSERSHELASLRVLGFRRGEISLILLGELALLTVAALPVGAVLGRGLLALIVGTVDSEVYRFPMYVSMQAVARASLGVVAGALVSGLLVRRRLDRLDLVAVLKVRE